MKIHGGRATGTIALECTHINGLQNLPANQSVIRNWFEKFNENGSVANDNQLVIRIARIASISGGYRVVIALESRVAGKYFLRLRESPDCNNMSLRQFCTFDGLGNIEVFSNEPLGSYIEVIN
jgi:hypothetical protein